MTSASELVVAVTITGQVGKRHQHSFRKMASSTLLLTRIAIWATQLLIFLCITTTSSVVEPSSEISIHYLTDRRTEVAIRDLEQDKRNEILTKNLRFEADNYPTILHTNAELLKRDAMSKLFSQVNLQHVTAISSEMQRTTTSDPVSTLASVAVQFINLNVYGSWNCQDDPLTVITYGTGICFTLASGAFSFDSVFSQFLLAFPLSVQQRSVRAISLECVHKSRLLGLLFGRCVHHTNSSELCRKFESTQCRRLQTEC